MPAFKKLEVARIERSKEEFMLMLPIASPGQVPRECDQRKEDGFGELRAET